MRNLILYLLIVAFGDIHGQNYSLEDRQSDTTLICNASQEEISFLKTMTTLGIDSFQKLQAKNDTLTACAKVRLSKWNGVSYASIDKFSRDKLGEVLIYPSCEFILQKPYVTYDEQVRFFQIKDASGNTISSTPYVTKSVHTGKKITRQYFDPVTWDTIPPEKIPRPK